MRSALVRRLVKDDVDRVLQVEYACFGQAGWSARTLTRFLTLGDAAGIVAEFGHNPAGHLFYRVLRSRREVVLARLAVAPGCRRRGVARALFGAFYTRAVQAGVERVVCVVPETCLPMQLFLRSVGVPAVAVLRDAFGPQDGYRFELPLARPAVK